MKNKQHKRQLIAELFEIDPSNTEELHKISSFYLSNQCFIDSSLLSKVPRELRFFFNLSQKDGDIDALEFILSVLNELILDETKIKQKQMEKQSSSSESERSSVESQGRSDGYWNQPRKQYGDAYLQLLYNQAFTKGNLIKFQEE